MEDNVRAQYRLVTEKFGIRRLKLVLGWSIGAGQAFQWATSFPDMVERILPFGGSARTSPHNFVSSNSQLSVLYAWITETPRSVNLCDVCVGNW